MVTQTVGPPVWTVTALEEVVIELLASLNGVSGSEMRHTLEQKGGSMPVDSLDLLDILQEFRQRTGLGLPVRKLRSQTMRSVEAFARFAALEATQTAKGDQVV